MSATQSWSFHCDLCGSYATVAGKDMKEAENTLVSVLKWRTPSKSRHSCERHQVAPK